MAHRVARFLAWSGVLLVGVVALAKMFFFGVYYVDSESMEPTLHGAPSGGDYLLVTDGDRSDLRRFDLVVILREGEREPCVKRVAALPGERVTIRDEILWIDGEPLPESEPRPEPITIFDERLDFERWFSLPKSWSREGDGWLFDGREVAAGTNAGLSYLTLSFRDHHVGPDGELVEGDVPMSDGIVEFGVRQGDPPARLRLGLLERGDTFEAVIEPPEQGEAALRLIRRNPVLRNETVAEGRTPFAAGDHSLRFSNVDNRVRLEIDGETRLAYDYEKNADHPLEKTSVSGQRVYLGGEQGRAHFRRIRVLRDLDYTAPEGARYAVGEELTLGPDEILVLGDNSADSVDGRTWGPTSLEEVIGRPLAVIWPPARARWLRRAGEP